MFMAGFVAEPARARKVHVRPACVHLLGKRRGLRDGMTRIKVLAWTHIVLSGGLLLVGLWLCVVIALSADKYSRAPEMILPMVATLSLFVLIPGLAGGIGLLFLQSWARV